MTNRELNNYIERYLQGEAELFDMIYEEVKTSVYLSIYNIIKDKQLVEDLMQDAFMKAIQSIDSYKLGTNFKAWISRIGRNLAINVYNKRKRETILDPQDSEYVFDAPISNDSPLLDIAMKILDEDERDIVVYHIVLGFTFKSISEIMNTPPGTVFWIYQKALKKIRKEL